MELNSPYIQRFELPEAILGEFYGQEVPESFVPSFTENRFTAGESPSLITADLSGTLTWLQQLELPKPFEREIGTIPFLLFSPDFSTGHLLFHYDGTSNSTELIKNFIRLFGNSIQDSKATIISPSFIPKSKIREEHEIIELVASSTKETSFIKFNFVSIGDFCSYGIVHNCTLLVTTKNYQADLAEVLFQFSKREVWDGSMSFYLSL